MQKARYMCWYENNPQQTSVGVRTQIPLRTLDARFTYTGIYLS